jgi:hypothetical protein
MSARVAALFAATQLGGCLWGDCERCPPPSPVQQGAYAGGFYEVAEDDTAVEPALTEVEAIVSRDELTVTYVDEAGRAWLVRYAVGPTRSDR